MAAQTIDLIRARVTSLLTRVPFAFVPSPVPFDFKRLPAMLIDGSFCLESESAGVTGGCSFTETRVDLLHVAIARHQEGQPDACYQALLADCASVTSAIVRDGAILGGDYDVRDEGRGFRVLHEPGRAFSVLRLTLPVDYEAQL
jgi:hypothetical protein